MTNPPPNGNTLPLNATGGLQNVTGSQNYESVSSDIYTNNSGSTLITSVGNGPGTTNPMVDPRKMNEEYIIRGSEEEE